MHHQLQRSSLDCLLPAPASHPLCVSCSTGRQPRHYSKLKGRAELQLALWGDLLTVPFSSKRKRYLQELAGGIDEQPPGPKRAKTGRQANGQGTEQLAASHYILTPQQMRDREFAPSLYTEGLELAPCFVDTLPAGVLGTHALASPLYLLLLLQACLSGCLGLKHPKPWEHACCRVLHCCGPPSATWQPARA